MKELLKSASRIVFMLMALAACAGFFVGRLEAKDFMVLAMAAFSFYFTRKRNGDNEAPSAGN